MKGIFVTSLLTLALFTAVLFNACKYDKCDQVSCAFGGVCKDGTCLCQTGYEGEHCETITRDKFKGTWGVNEDGTLSSPAQFSASILDGPQINQVYLHNFQNIYGGEDLTGIVYKDTLTIPEQVMSDGAKIKGWATITDTNPFDQHYFQHAVMNVYFISTDINGVVNEYGTGGSGPSLWTK